MFLLILLRVLPGRGREPLTLQQGFDECCVDECCVDVGTFYCYPPLPRKPGLASTGNGCGPVLWLACLCLFGVGTLSGRGA